jgi:hypothetical protein
MNSGTRGDECSKEKIMGDGWMGEREGMMVELMNEECNHRNEWRSTLFPLSLFLHVVSFFSFVQKKVSGKKDNE